MQQDLPLLLNPEIKVLPCTRCGDCCKGSVCSMGESVYKTTTTPCPGLRVDKDKSSCKLMEIMNEEHFAFMTLVMGIGMGCTNENKYFIDGDNNES